MICQRVGCLPKPGGLFDQEAAHVHRLERVYEAVAKFEKEEMDKIKRAN